MYILIRESIEPGIAIVSAAHASLACYLKYQNSPEVSEWLNPGPFYKVICKVSDEEFEQAKSVADHVVLTESRLNHEEVSIVFKPRSEYPKEFKSFSLWRD